MDGIFEYDPVDYPNWYDVDSFKLNKQTLLACIRSWIGI